MPPPHRTTMRAITFDPRNEPPVRFAEVEPPQPRPGTCVVDVRAIGINFVDIAYARQRRTPGDVLGLDFAGSVREPAPDGTGPAAGSRVVGFANSAWAQQVAAPVADLAAIPDSVDDVVAASLPAAGVTAWQVAARLGDLAGRPVLVTGASGGVGQFVTQILASRGVHVTALVSTKERAVGLRDLDNVQVAVATAPPGPFAAVVDMIGGDVLASAFTALEPGGRLLAVGQASNQPTTVHFEDARRFRPGTSIEAFAVHAPFGPDLKLLLDEVVAGRLVPVVNPPTDWTNISRAIRSFTARATVGKIVLQVQ